MILGKKIINYKILDRINLYNFNIKFDLVQNYMKKLWFFLHETICRSWY